MKDESSQQDFDRAFEELSQPDVYSELMLASSPEAAMKIAESLGPVEKLVELGADAGSDLLQLLQDREANDYVKTAALYVVLRTRPPGAREELGQLILSGSFKGMGSELASRAFLNFSEIDAPREQAIDVAFREAQKLQN